MLGHKTAIKSALRLGGITHFRNDLPPIKGQPRIIGAGLGGYLQAEIIGRASDVRKVTVRGVVPVDRPDIAQQTGELMGATVAQALPDVATPDMVPALMRALQQPDAERIEHDAGMKTAYVYREASMELPHIARLTMRSHQGWLTLIIERIG